MSKKILNWEEFDKNYEVIIKNSAGQEYAFNKKSIFNAIVKNKTIEFLEFTDILEFEIETLTIKIQKKVKENE